MCACVFAWRRDEQRVQMKCVTDLNTRPSPAVIHLSVWVITAWLSQPWLPAAHNNTRGARGRAGRLELGGRERLTDECEARRTEGVAQEQLCARVCVCVTV